MVKRQCETAKFPITRMESRCKSFKGQKKRAAAGRVKQPKKSVAATSRVKYPKYKKSKNSIADEFRKSRAFMKLKKHALGRIL
jgi:hypothetical protein